MSRIKFGLFAPQVGAPFSVLKERAQLADRLGFHSIWFVDHMWSRGLPDLDHLEAWTVMSAIAAVTERIGIGTLVLCNSYRNPALLAKMASSLDQVSNGRFLLGLGAGWMDEEYRAYGYPFPSVRVRIEQLEEALAIIKLLFKEPRATFQGKYYARQRCGEQSEAATTATPADPHRRRRREAPAAAGRRACRHLELPEQCRARTGAQAGGAQATLRRLRPRPGNH